MTRVMLSGEYPAADLFDDAPRMMVTFTVLMLTCRVVIVLLPVVIVEVGVVPLEVDEFELDWLDLVFVVEEVGVCPPRSAKYPAATATVEMRIAATTRVTTK